jgi:hypothetical protein
MLGIGICGMLGAFCDKNDCGVRMRLPVPKVLLVMSQYNSDYLYIPVLQPV